jgi:phosphatidate cytidylyltransferase
MLIKRVIVAIVLALVGIPAMIIGGVFYCLIITILVGIAAWEFGHIFEGIDNHPFQPLLVGGVVILLVLRGYFPSWAPAALSILILAAMTWHLFDYEHGRNQAATDFTITVTGMVYLGWIGAYLIDVRNLQGGQWWLALVLPEVWIADMAAYFIGSHFGRHQLCPRLSPKKTWEGFLAGVFFGTAVTVGLTALWHGLGGPDVTWWQGILLGATLCTLTTLGDLGESLIKRQAGMKDSSNILPGHGGIFDRIDSWLWAGVIGYFFIVWFLI